MTRSELYYQSRINLLKERTGKENGKIIAKLQRKIRKLKQSDRGQN